MTNSPRWPTRLFACALLPTLLVISACNDASGPRPVPARAERGDVQNLGGTVAQAVSPVPSVTVLDAKNRPLANVEVTFSASHGGTVGMAIVRTDAQGTASVGSWTLGTLAGTQTLTATVPGLPPILFEAEAHADSPAAVEAHTTNLQGIAGSAIPLPELKVRDSFGNGTAGVSVRFRVTQGSGAAIAEQAVTDSLGVARAGNWTLSRVAGLNTVVATVTGLESTPVTFSATTSAGAATQLVVVQIPPFVQSGLPMTSPALIRVADQFGNVVAQSGVAVATELLSSAATLTAAPVTTDGSGSAALDLRIAGPAGRYTLRFRGTGLLPVDTSVLLVGGEASALALVTPPSANVVPGTVFPVQPVIELRDAHGNAATAHPGLVNVSLESGTGVLSGFLSAQVMNGRASFTNLAFTGTGTFRLRFSAGTLPPIITGHLASDPSSNCTQGQSIVLDYALGQTARFRTDSIDSPRCLRFDRARNGAQQYLVMFEHMPLAGGIASALFPGVNVTGPFSAGIATAPLGMVPPATTLRPTGAQQEPQPDLRHSWDFGGGPIYELQPATPSHLVPQPRVKRISGDLIDSNSAAAPAVGDTLLVFLEPIPRLGIPAGTQKAVVRYVTAELVFAEDVRLGTTLRRQTGGFNRPMTIAEMDSIAQLYAAEPRRQADRLFNGVYNAATTAQDSRVIAVHTLMPSDNIWGYTYPNTNVFAFDFWVTSDGSTKGVNQSAVRLAHNLFMHEIAHTRHFGLLERAGHNELRGNLWLIEGFARFTERLPIASYLLGQDEPSRTSNYVLGLYPNINPPSREDVPVYLNQGAQMIAGYGASSYIFDYLADQVAASAGDWRAALRGFVVNGGSEQSLDAAVAAALPGLGALPLITRARVALFTDDIGTSGLPQWTQYLQYDLRGSRPAGQFSSVDPRNAWPRIVPGTSYSDRISIPVGAAYGYIIDGAGATADAHVLLDPTSGPHGVVSITRIR